LRVCVWNYDRKGILDKVGTGITGNGDSQEQLQIRHVYLQQFFQTYYDTGEDARNKPDHQAEAEICGVECGLLGRLALREAQGCFEPNGCPYALAQKTHQTAQQQSYENRGTVDGC
jgi:hypothetical protein